METSADPTHETRARASGPGPDMCPAPEADPPAGPGADAECLAGPLSEAGLSRRQFVGGAAALVAGLALPAGLVTAGAAGAREARAGDASAPGLSTAREAAAAPSRRPNLVVLITDQERFPMHWPEGWAEEHLPNRRRLARHGLTFRRAFCAASMCSPSRATIFTGVYPAEHGVTEVLQTGTDPDVVSQGTLPVSRRNMADLLAAAGYDVQYRGKWHMSKDTSGTELVQSRHALERYRFRGWLPPDAGSDQSAPMLGGGTADWDGLTAVQAAAFLRGADPRGSRPFALIVCIVNPHDIMGYPSTWAQASYSRQPPYAGTANYMDQYPECVQQGISLPSTWDEVLRTNHKPHCQWQSTEMWSEGLGLVRSPDRTREYVDFYAYLHRRSDEDIGTVLDALEADGTSPRGRWSSGSPTTGRWVLRTAACARRATTPTRRRSTCPWWSRTRCGSRSRWRPTRSPRPST